MWLESHEWEREMDQEKCLGIKRPHQVCRPLQTCSLAALWGHAPLPSTTASWKKKKLCSLLLRLYNKTMSQNLHSIQKRGEKPKQVVNFSSPS